MKVIIVLLVVVIIICVRNLRFLDGTSLLPPVINIDSNSVFFLPIKTQESFTTPRGQFFNSRPVEKKGLSSTSKTTPKCGIALMMRKPEDLPLWLKHHRELGIKKFYIRMEDSPGWEDYLKTQPDIEYEIGESDPTNNYETVQPRQIKFVNQSLKKAEKDQLDWLFNTDADELIEGDLGILATLSPEIKTITMHNVEAIYDGTEKTCFDARRFKRCSKTECRSYGNGKSAGRVEPRVSLKGCHNFAYDGDHTKNTKRLDFEDLHVLHFDSCSFGSWAEKFRHMSKGTTDKDKTPFPYYEESKKIAASAYETYMNVVSNDKTKDENIYTRS